MNRVTLRDYRCFHGRQHARLAPLTLLVGENSTGKTSFMAMVRALCEIAYNNAVPDFKEEPYDLGSFAEITHHRGGRAGRAESFEAGFRLGNDEVNSGTGHSFNVIFEQRGTAPVPVTRQIWDAHTSVSARQLNGTTTVTAKTENSEWDTEFGPHWRGHDETSLVPMFWFGLVGEENDNLPKKPSDEDSEAVRKLLDSAFRQGGSRPFASAPVRSKPRRTYDPARPSRDPEGDYVPMYLAHLFRHQQKREWNTLKKKLEAFGRISGLFDELSIKSLGIRESEPFQVQIRKLGMRTKGPWRNLIDVGYGVSQALPLVTELLRTDAPSTFLLQQPEVHLHPSAQAALGSLFCEVANNRQLIVETHSDHMINRIRMEVRDGVGSLTPDQVSILYFERIELEVRIHSLRIDEGGNIVDAPDGYGRFFLEETERSLGY